MIKFLAALSLALLSAPAMAQSPAQTASVENKVAQNDLDRIVCEKEEQIGTRLGARKVCKTVREWQEQRRIQRNDFEKVQQVVNQSPGH